MPTIPPSRTRSSTMTRKMLEQLWNGNQVRYLSSEQIEPTLNVYERVGGKGGLVAGPNLMLVQNIGEGLNSRWRQYALYGLPEHLEQVKRHQEKHLHRAGPSDPKFIYHHGAFPGALVALTASLDWKHFPIGDEKYLSTFIFNIEQVQSLVKIDDGTGGMDPKFLAYWYVPHHNLKKLLMRRFFEQDDFAQAKQLMQEGRGLQVRLKLIGDREAPLLRITPDMLANGITPADRDFRNLALSHGLTNFSFIVNDWGTNRIVDPRKILENPSKLFIDTVVASSPNVTQVSSLAVKQALLAIARENSKRLGKSGRYDGS